MKPWRDHAFWQNQGYIPIKHETLVPPLQRESWIGGIIHSTLHYCPSKIRGGPFGVQAQNRPGKKIIGPQKRKWRITCIDRQKKFMYMPDHRLTEKRISVRLHLWLDSMSQPSNSFERAKGSDLHFPHGLPRLSIFPSSQIQENNMSGPVCPKHDHNLDATRVE